MKHDVEFGRLWIIMLNNIVQLVVFVTELDYNY